MPRRPLGDVRADGARAGVQHRLPHQRVDEAVRTPAELRSLANAVPRARPRRGGSGARASSHHVLLGPTGRFASRLPDARPSQGRSLRRADCPHRRDAQRRSRRRPLGAHCPRLRRLQPDVGLRPFRLLAAVCMRRPGLAPCRRRFRAVLPQAPPMVSPPRRRTEPRSR